jgi:hypothetical protein
MTEVAQVAADNLDLVSQIPEMFADRIAAEDHWAFLTVFNEQAYNLQANETRSAGNECRHEMNVSFHDCGVSFVGRT